MKVFTFIVALFVTAGSLTEAFAEGLAYSGSLSNRYRYRTTGNESDHNLQTLFSMEMGDAMVDRIYGSVQAGGIFDLDGRTRTSQFTGIYDSFDSRAVGRLYHAFVDLKSEGAVEKIRLGRQFRYDFDNLYYDGLTFETKTAHGVTVTGYGGLPVHLFESQVGVNSRNWLAGGDVTWDIIPAVRLKFDAAHITDQNVDIRASIGRQEDTLIGGSIYWDATDNWTLSSRFTSFTDQPKDIDFVSRFRIPENNFTLHFHFYSLIEGYGIRAVDWDAFGFVSRFEPYTEFTITATKGFGDHFAVDGGFAQRSLVDYQTVSAFNHGFERFFMTLSTMKLPLDGMSLSLTGDYYRATDSDLKNNMFGLSFSADEEIMDRKLKFSAGTSHYLYRYNLFMGDESTNVQTYYGRVIVKLIKPLEARLGYEFETNQINNFHTVDTRVVWKF